MLCFTKADQHEMLGRNREDQVRLQLCSNLPEDNWCIETNPSGTVCGGSVLTGSNNVPIPDATAWELAISMQARADNTLARHFCKQMQKLTTH